MGHRNFDQTAERIQRHSSRHLHIQGAVATKSYGGLRASYGRGSSESGYGWLRGAMGGYEPATGEGALDTALGGNWGLRDATSQLRARELRAEYRA